MDRNRPSNQASASQHPTMLPTVATLGMFILDCFQYDDDYCATERPPFRPDEFYIGGGGTYATVGARMWLPPARITMIIHQGTDFPRQIAQQLQTYSPDLFTFLSDANHPITTRALNTYYNERRDFAYLTPKRQIRLDEIYKVNPRPPDYIHVIASPKRLAQHLEERAKLFPDWRPHWIWEPVPDSCQHENLSTLLQLSGEVCVFSPNDLEASMLLGHAKAPGSLEEIETMANYFNQAGFQSVVIRSGRHGAYAIGGPKSDLLKGGWIPPLVQSQEQVVDQTGAGNAFLGGLMAGLACGEDLLKAACYGSVSAGFTITQLGLPTLTKRDDNNVRHERWNGELCPFQKAQELLNLSKMGQLKPHPNNGFVS